MVAGTVPKPRRSRDIDIIARVRLLLYSERKVGLRAYGAAQTYFMAAEIIDRLPDDDVCIRLH
jgi:hypothetical protein